MDYVEIDDRKYPRVTIVWKDIIGDCAVAGADESRELVCPTIFTEGYLFDVFEDDGERYVRTFATYQKEDEVAFGDRNCFPFSVLTRKSQRDVEMAVLLYGK